MLVVSLDALVCGLKLPRALRGFVQQAHEPASFVLRCVIAAGRRGASDAHQFYGARLSCRPIRFGVTIGLLVMRQPLCRAVFFNGWG